MLAIIQNSVRIMNKLKVCLIFEGKDWTGVGGGYPSVNMIILQTTSLDAKVFSLKTLVFFIFFKIKKNLLRDFLIDSFRFFFFKFGVWLRRGGFEPNTPLPRVVLH